MEPIRLDNIIDEDVSKELEKIQQALKGIGDESYRSFSRLTNESNKAFNSLNQDTRQQLLLYQQLTGQLRENEVAQEALIVKLKEGIISSQVYANAQQQLVLQQVSLKEQISGLNTLLEHQVQLTTGLNGSLKESKSSSDLLGGSFSSMSKYAFENASNFKELQVVFQSLRSSGINPWVLGLATAFSLLKIAIEGSARSASTFRAVFAYMASLLKTTKDAIAQWGSAFGDIFTGNFMSGFDKMGKALTLDLNRWKYAGEAARASLNQDKLNKDLSYHNDLIEVGRRHIAGWRNSLTDANIPLKERQVLIQNILDKEKLIRDLNIKDLSSSYDNFINKTKQIDSTITSETQNKIISAQKYFSTLVKGDKLSNKQDNDLINTLRDITETVDIGWDEGQKEQFKSFFKEAIKINQDYYDNIRDLQSSVQGNAISDTMLSVPSFTPPPKSQLQQLQEELNLRKQQYAQMEAFERGMGTEAAGQAYGELKKQGSDYVDYLSRLIETFKSKSDRTAGDNESLGYLFQERETAKPQEPFDPAPIQRELEKQKEFYKLDIDAYIAYLNEKRALLNSDRSEAGGQKRQLLDQALEGAEGEKSAKLNNLLQQYQGYTAKMTSIVTSYQSEMTLLNQALTNASTEEERKRIEDAMNLRSDGYTASMASLETENQGFSKVLFGDLQNISKGALAKAIADAKHFIQEWKKQAGELSPETVAVLDKIEKGIDNASEKSKSDLPRDLQAAAQGLQSCADMAMVFDSSLGSVLQTSAEIAKGAADIATGVAQFGANPLQGATSIMSGISSIVSSVGKRIQENKKILGDYLQGLTETYSKELEYNSILRERLRLQQQLGETGLEYFSRLESELERQKTSVNSEYQEVWGKLMGEQYVSGTNYKHGTWFRKAKTWNEYGSLSGKSYEDIESLYTQDKLEGSAKILFERLKQLKEEGASVVEMMDQLKEEMKESWTGTTSSAIADSIVQGFMDGKRSAADFADNFQELMRTAMMQAVKMKYLEGPLNQWYDRFAEASEGGLTEDKIAALREQYNQIIENAAREAENMDRILGLPAGTVDATREATASGIASMSQDTASELNGNFYALQYMTSNIDRNVTSIQSVLYLASDQWIRIEENTRYCRKLETIESNMASIRKDMQDINNKGILMRTR